MQICIHWKDSPKPVNHRMTFKEGPPRLNLTTSDSQPMICYKLVSHWKTSTTNNKRVTSTFKFGCPHLTLKEDPKAKSDNTSEDSRPMIF